MSSYLRLAILFLTICSIIGCQQVDESEAAATQPTSNANFDKLNAEEQPVAPALSKLQGDPPISPAPVQTKPATTPVIEEKPVAKSVEKTAPMAAVATTPAKANATPTNPPVTTAEPAQPPVTSAQPEEKTDVAATTPATPADKPVVQPEQTPVSKPAEPAEPVMPDKPATTQPQPVTQPVEAPVTVTPAPQPVTPPVPQEPSANELLYRRFEKKAGEYEYKVFVDGKERGKQKMTISKQDDGTLVVKFDFSIRVSYIVYTYTYNMSGSEVWKGIHLQTLQSATNDNGTEFSTDLRSDGTNINGKGKEGAIQARHPATTTNIWNLGDIYQILGKDSLTLVDSESGRVADYKIFPLGEEVINVAGSKVKCLHIKLGETAATNWEAWFSAAGVLIRQKDIVQDTKTEFLLHSWK